MGLFSDKNQVGLYVDSETISVVSGQVAGASVNVTGFTELRLPTFLEADPESRQKTLADIRAALSRAGAKSRSVLVSVPGDGSIIRHFELPLMTKKEERGAVRYEAQKYMPFEAKSLYYDYEIYPDLPRKRNQVVYFACKKQWVDSLSALLTLAGTKISQVELVSQSVARAYHQRAATKKDEVSLLIISNNQNTADFIVQTRGSVLTTRHISLARSADGIGLDIPMLVSDVRISLDYFSENFKNMKVQRLFLVTPFAGEAQAVCDALQKDLSLPADAGTLFEPPSPAVSTAAAVAAYGLTLGVLEKKAGRRISLKPTEASSAPPIVTWEQEKKQLQDIATKEVMGIAGLFALLFFVFGGATWSKSQELQRAIESYPKARTASLNDTLEVLQAKQALMAQNLAFFNSLTEQRVYLTRKMSALAKLVPPTVRLSKWSYQDELSPQGTSNVVMKIDGYVLTPDTGSALSIVNQLTAKLTADKNFALGFSEIRIARTSKENVDGQSATRFALDCSKKKV